MSVAGLPNLNLSLHKHKSVSSASSNTNSLSNANTNNVNIFLDDKLFEMTDMRPQSRNSSVSPMNTPMSSPRKRISRPQSVAPIPEEKDDLELADEVAPQPSPKDKISMDFMKTLIRIQNEILLDNILLVNNLKELGDRIIYRDCDLKEMIEILMNIEKKDAIEIRTEDAKKTSCGCKIPLYVKIKSITINKTIPFLHTEIATRMSDEFKISLEYCV
jgi:hypothetical protein